MKKEYFSPEFDFVKISFDEILSDDNVLTSKGEIGRDSGDPIGEDT